MNGVLQHGSLKGLDMGSAEMVRRAARHDRFETGGEALL